MPRRRRARRAFCALFLTAAGLLACSSKYGDSVTDGSKTGRCFPNGTCNEGLVCVQDVCLEPSNGSEGGLPALDSRAPEAAAGATDARVEESGDATTFDGAPVCMKKQLGDGCLAGDDCCSGACSEALKCTAACKKLLSPCTTDSTSECCAGSWCGVAGTTPQCLSCVSKNGTMGTDSQGNPVEASCCSRSGNLLTKKCN